MNTEISICPLCGSKTGIHEIYVPRPLSDTPDRHYQVRCLSCHLAASSFFTISFAVDAWNALTKTINEKIK